MKVSVGKLRKVIREDYLRGVPEWMFQEATKKYVDELRQHITKFIYQNKSQDAIARREAIDEMNDALAELEENVQADCDDMLFTFIQGV